MGRWGWVGGGQGGSSEESEESARARVSGRGLHGGPPGRSEPAHHPRHAHGTTSAPRAPTELPPAAHPLTAPARSDAVTAWHQWWWRPIRAVATLSSPCRTASKRRVHARPARSGRENPPPGAEWLPSFQCAPCWSRPAATVANADGADGRAKWDGSKRLRSRAACPLVRSPAAASDGRGSSPRERREVRWAASSDQHETLVASGYRPEPEKPVKQPSSRAHMHTRRASRERGKRARSSEPG